MPTIPEIQVIKAQAHTLAAICYNPETEGEPVILLHGITSGIHFWDKNLLPEYLSQGPCYSLSLPGHYPAAAPEGFTPQSVTAKELAAVTMQGIRSLVGDQPVTVIGHSTGGFMAVNLAAYYPDQIRRVVSISGFANGRWTDILGTLQNLARSGWLGRVLFIAAYKLLQSSPGLFNRFLVFYPQQLTEIEKSAMLATLYADFKQLNLKTMCKYFQAMPDIDISPMLANVAAPTLAIAGGSDTYVPPEQALLIAAGVQSGGCQMLPGAGHLPFIDNPGQFQQILRQWLQKHP